MSSRVGQWLSRSGGCVPGNFTSNSVPSFVTSCIHGTPVRTTVFLLLSFSLLINNEGLESHVILRGVGVGLSIVEELEPPPMYP